MWYGDGTKSILWGLIEDEAEAIQGYLKVLPDLQFADSPEDEMFNTVIRQIVSDERDHLNSLRFLYDRMEKDKPSEDTKELAQKAYDKYKEDKKLIK